MNFKNWFKKVVYLFVAIHFSIANAGSYDDFFIAVERNDAGGISRLLNRGFDPNSLDPDGRPGLYSALQKGSFEVAEALLKHPQTDVNMLNATDESPLMVAALKGELAWCQRLLERGAVVNKPGWSALHYAASGTDEGAAAVVKLLLDKGANINAAAPNGTTPLMMAAMYGPDSSVQLLLSRGADTRRKNDLGMSAADFAQKAGRNKLVERLRQP